MFIVYPKRSLFWFNQKWRNTTSYKTVLRRWLIVWNLSKTKYAMTIQNWTPQVLQVSLRSEVWATETFIKIINPTGTQVWTFFKIYLKLTRLEFLYDYDLFLIWIELGVFSLDYPASQQRSSYWLYNLLPINYWNQAWFMHDSCRMNVCLMNKDYIMIHESWYRL